MSEFELGRFRGIFPAAMTFFDAEGNLDAAACKTHWNWLIEQGVHGLVIGGTSGEFISLKPEESLRLFDLALEVNAGRVPIIAGSGHASTRWTIALSQQAQERGVDGVIIILPYFLRPTPAGVMEHYRALRRNVDLPIMLYNNPANTACRALSPLEMNELVEEGVIQMVKSTMESVIPIHELSVLTADRMQIFYGSFLAAYEGLTAGAHGWISGVLNVVAPTAIKMYRAINLERDIDRGFELWKRILPIVQLYTHQQLGTAHDLSIYRGMLNLWGKNGGYSRSPVLPLTSRQMSLLEQKLNETGWQDPAAQADW